MTRVRCRKCRAVVDDPGAACPACGAAPPALRTVFDYIARGEEIVIATALGLMVLLVLAQIILRYFFSTGIMGGSEIVRHLVLWVAFLGAGLAARDGTHIRIELSQHLLPARMHRLCDLVTSLFSVFICSILVYASIRFVSVDLRGGGTIAFFNTPLWLLQIIIPIGYAAVALRFAASCVEHAHAMVKGDGTS